MFRVCTHARFCVLYIAVWFFEIRSRVTLTRHTPTDENGQRATQRENKFGQLIDASFQPFFDLIPHFRILKKSVTNQPTGQTL